ncbi:MAG: hypothetical protein WDO73_01855 [Ignavibacteriota bacterium]
MGYTSPLQELAERFHASQQLLQALNPGANFGQVGQQLTVPNALTMPPGQAATVTVSKVESSVRATDASGETPGVLCRHHRKRARPLAGGRVESPVDQARPTLPL